MNIIHTMSIELKWHLENKLCHLFSHCYFFFFASQNKGGKWKMNVYKSNFTLPNFPSSSNNLHLNMPNIYSWGTSRRDVKEWKFSVVKLSFPDLSVDICNINLENTQIANSRHIAKNRFCSKNIAANYYCK